MNRDPFVAAASAVFPDLDWVSHSQPHHLAAIAWAGPFRLCLEAASVGYHAVIGEGDRSIRGHADTLEEAARILGERARAYGLALASQPVLRPLRVSVSVGVTVGAR